MRRLDQSTNKITAMFTESGLSVIQFWREAASHSLCRLGVKTDRYFYIHL